MKALFGLKADDYNELPTFVGVVKDTPEDIRNQVIGEFLRLHKTSQHFTSDNEATRCEFISRIIYGVASIYGGEIKVYPQYEISGSHDKGPVNWAIKIGNIIIIITEAKKRISIKELHRMRSNCRHPSSAILKNVAMISAAMD
ncbi:hypothetical protein RhiirA4_246654 [Rhizophagus irregularis]|uniref:Uncharacterized protein n=1 Tax=Rhizophagus irregularis TaxID=588596 RepID=A0A2I1GS65_9GLOM|nr:hypothetical protein RhiirA4_246654 [Rhizophagus irregularis]